jgi:hypothetical protein
MGVIKFGVVVLVGLAACGSEKVNQCDKDSDCTNIAYPFCDVNGEYSPSGGESHVCTVTPADCPVERCGCSPGATTCSGDALTVCDTDGTSTTMETCALGCGTTDRCFTFQPMNGLGPALLAAANEPDIVVPDKARINTDTGAVTDSANVTVQIATLVVNQTNGPDIRVFFARSLDISDAVVTGGKALAFVAPGKITMRGVVDASANAATPGPGAQNSGPCVGAEDASVNTAGGGGNATSGGQGVSTNGLVNGGAAQTSFEPLMGGCCGGIDGGAGGGAVQIDSLVSVELFGLTNNRRGLLDVGGGGDHQGHFGGGAGGTVVVEAPTVIISGAVTANGGGGGGSGPGSDATEDGVPAPGGYSGQLIFYGGSGGTRTQAAGDGLNSGGGGGAVGRLFVRTLDGNFDMSSDSLISAVATMGMLTKQ